MRYKNTLSWVSNNLIVKETKNRGHGLFAKNKIRKNELLAVLGGYVMPIKSELKLPKAINDNGIQINDKFVLGIKKMSEIEKAVFFNHSCEPNAGFGGQIFIRAMRDINKGEEVTFDYAMTLSRVPGVPAYKMKCFCSSKKCRGVITDLDWMKKDLQKKYRGYFQYYLEEKIKKLKNK
jgi:SET domain-containing protein